MSGLTLDTGALIALERGKRRAIALIDEARSRGAKITVPAPVVVEWWRGQQGTARRILDAFDVEPIGDQLARVAGEALATSGTKPSVVDAVVIASAAKRGDRVLTGDVHDFARLNPTFPAVRILSVSSERKRR